MWGKANCGPDFLKALSDGRLTIDIMDYDSFYTHDMTPYYRSDKGRSATIVQYKQTFTATKDMPWFKKTGKCQVEFHIGYLSYIIPKRVGCRGYYTV